MNEHTRGNGTAVQMEPNDDWTPYLKASDELLHLQRLSMVGKIACGIAHDLANMTMILGWRLSKIEYLASGNDDLQRMLQETVHAAGTAQELARRLVFLGRAPRAQPCAVEVNAAVRGAMSFFSGAMGQRVKIAVSCPGQDLNVWCDPVQFEQVLLNLVLNAREALLDGGCITASVRLMETAALQDVAHLAKGQPHFISLSIVDDGCGMSSEVREHIFEPFYTTKEGGTGMGLAVVKRVVEDMAGLLRVHSQVGHGTTVEVLLPRWTS